MLICAMSFDENPRSPERVVQPEKRTTKVNIGVVIGVVVFLAVAVISVVWVSRNPPQAAPTPVSSP